MPDFTGRLDFLRKNPRAAAFAALDAATRRTTTAFNKGDIDFTIFNGKKVVVIGSGVGGLTTAYELVKNNTTVDVKVFEARKITGGRCLSLRDKDVLIEGSTSDIYDPNPPPPTKQTVHFEAGEDDVRDGYEPYLNAGPGRIPSSHILLLNYLEEFRVPIEIYIMNSESNLVQTTRGVKSGPETEDPVVYRRIMHNTRGRIAELVYQNAESLLGLSAKDIPERVKQLQSLMTTFGELDGEGRYVVEETDPGSASGGATRAGFTEVPGIRPGEIAPSFTLDEILDSDYWDSTSAYQPCDYLWQQTSFHPVNGMDQVQKAFADAIENIRVNTIITNCPVTHIDYDSASSKYIITTTNDEGSVNHEADYVFCNAAIPFLELLLSENLLPGPTPKAANTGFSPEFCSALSAVFTTQKSTNRTQRFLANTTKVGWQADRSLWQKPSKPTTPGTKTPGVEVGVVPIFGGISWTDNAITQIWYPSNRYHDRLGILTGCYNFGGNAIAFGDEIPLWRIDAAREGAKNFGEAFACGLDNGVAIAWQNMKYINGGWTQWHAVDNNTEHYCNIVNGTGVNGSPNKTFFIVGDQASSLPGWQEGAVASALQALLVATVNYRVPRYRSLPDTRLMVEGV